MPDIHEPLAAEAQRQRPTRRPSIADLVDRHRSRRWRRYALVATVILVVIGGVAVLGGHGGGPPGPAATIRPTDSPSPVTVTGILEMVGGPAFAGPTVIPGEVVFTAPDGSEWTAHAANDGRFSIAVPPGQYAVTGHSPNYEEDQGVCRPARPVTVTESGGPAAVVVMCQRM